MEREIKREQVSFFFFKEEDGIRDSSVTGVQTCALPISLPSTDGTELAAYVARPAAPTGAGIVILPDVRGLFHFYEELAQRFAAAGVEAIAIDYFGRTAGMAPRPDDFDFMAHVAQVKLDQVTQDVAVAVAYLRSMPGARVSVIFTAGFCFGGFLSFLQGLQHHA